MRVFTDYKLFLMEKFAASATSAQLYYMCTLNTLQKKKTTNQNSE